MGKMVFFSPNAVNGMLTSHCDNLSTHHYHLTYHHCFDMQFRQDQTTQQYFRAVSTDHIDQKAICVVSYPVYYHSYPAARISASITSFCVSVSLESVVVAWFPPLRVRLWSYSSWYLSRLLFSPFSFLLAFLTLFWPIHNTNYQSKEWKLRKLRCNSSNSTETTTFGESGQQRCLVELKIM